MPITRILALTGEINKAVTARRAQAQGNDDQQSQPKSAAKFQVLLPALGAALVAQGR